MASTHTDGGSPLPGKSFNASHPDQTGSGPLVHDFTLPFDAAGKPGGAASRGRRMVVPHQVWMLQRLEGALPLGDPRLAGLLRPLRGGEQLLGLPALLRDCRLLKRGGRLYPLRAAAAAPAIPPTSAASAVRAARSLALSRAALVVICAYALWRVAAGW